MPASLLLPLRRWRVRGAGALTRCAARGPLLRVHGSSSWTRLVTAWTAKQRCAARASGVQCAATPGGRRLRAWQIARRESVVKAVGRRVRAVGRARSAAWPSQRRRRRRRRRYSWCSWRAKQRCWSGRWLLRWPRRVAWHIAALTPTTHTHTAGNPNLARCEGDRERARAAALPEVRARAWHMCAVCVCACVRACVSLVARAVSRCQKDFAAGRGPEVCAPRTWPRRRARRARHRRRWRRIRSGL